MSQAAETQRMVFYIPQAMRLELSDLIAPKAGTVPNLVRVRLMAYATALNSGGGYTDAAPTVEDLGFTPTPRSAVVLRVDSELIQQIEDKVGPHGGTAALVAKSELCRYLEEEREKAAQPA